MSGQVEYSFISSILSSGVNKNQIKSLLAMLGKDFDIINSVNPGDKFSIKTKYNSYNEEYVSAFYYVGSEIEFFAMRGKDNKIYNEYGELINNEYSFPLPTHFKVSSPFNLKRMHPVTNKISPHFGTDYATPIGTEVRSLSDGIIVKSRHNRFAGNYITIQHDDGNFARYLHLSERYVLPGDKITKGQLIGLTGNSGRTTGPHLHLELFVSGVPVNFERYSNKNRPFDYQYAYLAQKEKVALEQTLNDS
ncbi:MULTISPECIES: peptidoglycan DD-metalloendopeptidase family protein [Vibrio]|uniref:peptidoglycan DD-metalloendopeptidase family protein n=1 Tax=Vibrio TaxID=662 RepID=UPI001FCC9C10|nr:MULTISPECIES: peptidoglycan DD-metalloendopeptidase family protein [Vibrio]